MQELCKKVATLNTRICAYNLVTEVNKTLIISKKPITRKQQSKTISIAGSSVISFLSIYEKIFTIYI